MHIAASNPQWIGRDDVPEDVVTPEREIYPNSDEVQSKPEQAREKIVEGMLNKRFFGANVLTDQEWIHDSSKTVGQALAGGGRRGARVRALLARVDDRSTPRGAEHAAANGGAGFRRVLLKLSGEALMGDARLRDRRARRARARRGDRGRARTAASTSRSSSAAATSTAASRPRPRGWTARPPTTPACSRRC